MAQTATSDRARDLVNDLLTRAERIEALSRHNGRDTATESSVYRFEDPIGSLLDVRVTPTTSETTAAVRVIHKAPIAYGSRPGAYTTAEVRALRSHLLDAFAATEAAP